MNMTHGKSFKLQQTSVRSPAQQRVSGISRTATTPPSNNLSGSELTDSINISSLPDPQSDHSNSQSPPLGALTSSLDVSYNSTASGVSHIRIMGPMVHDYQYNLHECENRDYRSPLSPGPDELSLSDHFEDLGNYGGPTSLSRGEGVINGRGHARNGSLDDNTMLKQLRSGGQLRIVSLSF